MFNATELLEQLLQFGISHDQEAPAAASLLAIGMDTEAERQFCAPHTARAGGGRGTARASVLREEHA